MMVVEARVLRVTPRASMGTLAIDGVTVAALVVVGGATTVMSLEDRARDGTPRRADRRAAQDPPGAGAGQCRDAAAENSESCADGCAFPRSMAWGATDGRQQQGEQDHKTDDSDSHVAFLPPG